MKAIVFFECSGRVKTALRAQGIDAYSCDLKPSEIPNDQYHLQGDYKYYLPMVKECGLVIAHPDCTNVANSGVQWLFKIPGRYEQMLKDCVVFNEFLSLDVPYGIENPIHHRYAREYIRHYDQIIQPFYFSDSNTDRESKATCLWLHKLPPLMFNFTGGEGIQQSVWREAPGPNRKANRARTFQGIATAMATQWGSYLLKEVQPH